MICGGSSKVKTGAGRAAGATGQKQLHEYSFIDSKSGVLLFAFRYPYDLPCSSFYIGYRPNLMECNGYMKKEQYVVTGHNLKYSYIKMKGRKSDVLFLYCLFSYEDIHTTYLSGILYVLMEGNLNKHQFCTNLLSPRKSVLYYCVTVRVYTVYCITVL
jgi:hypothetical protein